jgi:hypothetical protein
MKIECPTCKCKLEIDSVGDFVSCFHCGLEFTVDNLHSIEETIVLPEEPIKMKSIWFIFSNFSWSKANWLALASSGLAIFLGILFVVSIVMAFVFKSKNPQALEIFSGAFGGLGMVIILIAFFAFLCLLLLNIILWIFLPLMVYSIKQTLEEAVREIKKLKNI